MELRLKRAYEPAEPTDGFRVLVDGIWPRGVSKVHAALDLWAKQVAPSAELREEFHHEHLSWEDFECQYRAELAANPAVEESRKLLQPHEVVTLVYAAHDEIHNNAIVLRSVLQGT